jgi:hypothetical protein
VQQSRVLYILKPTKNEISNKSKRYLYTNDELISKLNKFASSTHVYFKNGKKATGIALAEFLFKIDFIIARRDSEDGIERFFYEDHSKLQSGKIDFGMLWEVHPAYRWALNPRRVEDILREISIV